jgi:hypothetical protein
MEKINSRLIHKRLKLAYDLKTDQKLADFLGINQSTLSQNISRNAIVWDRIMEKCEFLSIDWLLTGEGKIFRNSSENSTEETEKSTKTTQYYEEINSYLLKRVKELEEELSDLKVHHGSDDAQDVDRGSYKKTGTL